MIFYCLLVGVVLGMNLVSHILMDSSSHLNDSLIDDSIDLSSIGHIGDIYLSISFIDNSVMEGSSADMIGKSYSSF